MHAEPLQRLHSDTPDESHLMSHVVHDVAHAVNEEWPTPIAQCCVCLPQDRVSAFDNSLVCGAAVADQPGQEHPPPEFAAFQH